MQDNEISTKTQQAYQQLRSDILSVRLRPGAPLKLKTLLEHYDFGWTPLREALSRLEAEKLVTASSNRGFAVAPVSQAELEDLTQARMVVEIPLLLESMQRGDDDWEAAIVTSHYRLSRCTISSGNVSEAAIDEWEERHTAFHNALLSAATSNWLKHFYTALWFQLRRHHRFLSLAPTIRAAAVLDEAGQRASAALEEAMGLAHHTELMNAVLNRDTESAHRLMSEHIGYTLDVYLQSESSIK